MKKFFVRLLIFLLVAAGAAWLLYPTVSDQIARWHNDTLMKRYHKAVLDMGSEQVEAMLQKAGSYNAALEPEGIPDVFSQERRRTSQGYQETMNVTDGVIGELVIPGIGVRLPIWHSGSGFSAHDRLVHVEESPLPAEQDGTNVVLAGPGIQKADGVLGDLALTDARMLEDLDRVIPEDLIYLNILDRTVIFRVEGVQTLAPEGLSSLETAGEEGSQLLTIISEHKGRRLVVRARRITAGEIRDRLVESDRAEMPSDVVHILLLGIPVLLAGFLIMWIIEKFKKRSYRLPTEQKKRRRKDEEEEETPPAEETGKPPESGKEEPESKDQERKKPKKNRGRGK